MEAAYQIYKAEPKYVHRPFVSDHDIIEKIKYIVLANTNISFETMNIKTRKHEIKQARQLFQYLVHKYTTLTLESVGALFEAKYNHATIIHAKDNIQSIIYLGSKDKYFEVVNNSEKQISNITTIKKASFYHGRIRKRSVQYNNQFKRI